MDKLQTTLAQLVSKDDIQLFLDAFTNVVKNTKEDFTLQSDKNIKLLEEVLSIVEKKISDINNTKENIENNVSILQENIKNSKQAIQEIKDYFEKMKQSIVKDVKSKVKDGKTPTEEDLLNLIRPLIPKLPKIEEIKLDTGEDIVNKINDLDNESPKIDAKHISNLPNFSIISNSNKYLGQMLDVDLSGLTKVNGKYVLNSSGGTWGSITGTLSNQTDLQTALNLKQDTLISGTNIKTINGNNILGSGDIVITSGGITGTGAAGQVSFWNGTSSQAGDNGLFWDNTNKRLGLGTNSPAYRLDVNGDINLATATTTVGSIRSNGGKILNVRGTSNLFVGGSTGNDTYTGTENVGVGNQVLQQLGAGTRNTGLGVYVLQALTSGSNNTGVGYGALGVTTGSTNTGLGYYAGRYNTTGSNQIFINGLDRTNYTGDQTGSPIYIQQSTTIGSQVVTLNGNTIINTETTSKAGFNFRNYFADFPAIYNKNNVTVGSDKFILASAPASGTFIGDSGSGNIYMYATGNNRALITSTYANFSVNTFIGATLSVTPSARLEVQTNSLGTSQTNSSGLALTNTTAAANGAQQISPAIRFSGFGWKSNATAASQAVDMRNYLLPVQGTTAPTSKLIWESSINGGAYSEVMSITSAGLLSIGGNLTSASSGFTINSTGNTTLSSSSVTNVTANGSASTFAVSNTGLTSLTGQSLTGSSTIGLLEMTQTWNTSGSPTAISLNITNTASGASAKLLDLKIGGTSMFNVDTSGNATTSGKVIAGGVVRLKSYTVATLPATPTQGDTAYVTDATAPTYLGVAVGGGAVVAPVFYNGTNWVTH